ncbi:hypothetical protein CIB93_20625 [Streptomyces sp. WZ.A104]|uniref:hypothetical protein n=1 Tax=Streptomyces sp. WZ.A104 TaxID=2023771 RepID=UPI000BBC73DF|nr:hypothetical protein [Streptomyces sp. WZ.A104]PCG84222.1 hypothetical protein CIB93_20625 [Streptomyces sp. WZ.A104]
MITEKPSRAVWCAEPHVYEAAAAGPAGGPLPVLLPREARRAALWRRVLDEQYDGPAATAPGRVVAALGAEASAPARLYASATGSVLLEDTGLDGIVREARRPGPALVVVGTAAAMRVGALARLVAAAREAGRPLGLLTGRDPAGLSFSVAKALLAPRASLGGLDRFDAPSHHADENITAPPPTLVRELVRPALVKLLRTHGEGGHAKLPGAVVCGVLDDAEFPEHPDLGCGREPRRCKRAGGRLVVGADEIASPVVAFVCCNGFNVAGELYPSNVSVALGLVDGWAGAVIAPIRPLIAPDAVVEPLRDGLAHGEPLGALTARLNQVCAELGQPDAFVLHGDPHLTVTGEPGTVPLPTDSGPVPAPDRITVTGGPAATPAAADDDLAAAEDWLVRLLRRLERAGRLRRALGSWLSGRPEDAEEAARVTRRLDSLERHALNALKWAQSRPTGPSREALLRSVALVRLSLGQTDRTLVRLLLDARASVDPFDLGYYDLRLTGTAQGPDCSRCGSPTEVQTFGGAGAGGDRHRAHSCLVCGPLSASRLGAPELTAYAKAPRVRVGERVELRVHLRVPEQTRRVVPAVQLYTRIFDKANDLCLYERAESLPARTTDVEVAFTVPEGCGMDLHSARFAVTGGLDFAYARARFAVLPARKS